MREIDCQTGVVLFTKWAGQSGMSRMRGRWFDKNATAPIGYKRLYFNRQDGNTFGPEAKQQARPRDYHALSLVAAATGEDSCRFFHPS
jgi:hypothetical protein